MKKKWIVIAVVLCLVLMLIPVKSQMRDGGTVVYKAVLYEVTDLHRLNAPAYEGGQTTYQEGIIVRILGIEVYNSTEK